jgi:hypothetical protein
MGDCGSLKLTAAENPLKRDSEFDDAAVARDGSGRETTMKVLVSSRGIHLHTTSWPSPSNSSNDGSAGETNSITHSLDRFVEPLDAAQRVIAFMVEACRTKRDD